MKHIINIGAGLLIIALAAFLIISGNAKPSSPKPDECAPLRAEIAKLQAEVARVKAAHRLSHAKWVVRDQHWQDEIAKLSKPQPPKPSTLPISKASAAAVSSTKVSKSAAPLPELNNPVKRTSADLVAPTPAQGCAGGACSIERRAWRRR